MEGLSDDKADSLRIRYGYDSLQLEFVQFLLFKLAD